MKLNSFVKKVLNDASLHLFLIVLIGFIIYSNTFNVPFQFDDTPNIVENYKLRGLSNSWPPSESRWFGFLTFALNYKLGGLNVTGYHIVNLMIHILNAILVYWLVTLTFRTLYFKVSVISASVSNQPNQFNLSTFQPLNYLPLFVALLFVAHPIQTQAVTYIVQRFTSLATFFYLLSLVMYIKYRIQNTEVRIQNTDDKTSCHSCESRNPGTKDWIPVSTGMTDMSGKRLHKILSLKSVFWYLGSVFSAVLAMKTKEISFTLPFIILLYEFCFFKSQNYELRTMNLRRLLYLMPFLLTLLIIPLSLISIDKPVGDAIGELRGYTAETTAINRWSYLFTQFRVIVTYIRLLFLPINQNVDYDFPIYHSFLNPDVFLSFLFLLSIFGLGVYLFYRSRFKVYGSLTCHPEPKAKGLRDSSATLQNDTQSPTRYTLHPTRLIAFGIFWFFITLSVESSIIPIKDVIFEHRLYLPSVGAIVAFSSAIFYVLRFKIHNSWLSLTTYCLLLTTIIIALSITTYQRNLVWQSEVSLWEDVVRKSSNKARGYNNIGNAYMTKGLTDKAIEHFNTALRLKPDFAEAHANLGTAYGKTGATDEAIKHFKISLILMPDDAEVHSDIGAAYGSKGWTDMAIEHLRIAIKLKPELVSAHNNIGLVYKSKGLIDKAVEHFQIAIKLKPEFAEIHNNLGNAYYKKGQFDDAIREYQTALILKPDDIEFQYNLSLVYSIKRATEGDKGRLKGN